MSGASHFDQRSTKITSARRSLTKAARSERRGGEDRRWANRIVSAIAFAITRIVIVIRDHDRSPSP
jgi:hypothetical protein